MDEMKTTKNFPLEGFAIYSISVTIKIQSCLDSMQNCQHQCVIHDCYTHTFLHLKHIIVTTQVVPEHFKQSLTPFHVNGILQHNFSVFVQSIWSVGHSYNYILIRNSLYCIAPNFPDQMFL